MGNTATKGPKQKARNKKQVRWKAADRPASPGKPRILPGSDLKPNIITICWSKPRSDGGSPVTGYLVEYRRMGSSHWIRATPLLVPYLELTLTNLEAGWRYQFRVSAENAVGLSDPSEESEPMMVALNRTDITAPQFTEELKDTVALENEKTEFVVHVLGQPPPTISWFKDGFEIFSSRRTRIITENDRSVLVIHQTALCDEGEIKCTATNRAGHVSTKARLKLEAPPRIRLPRNYEDGLLFETDEVIRLKISIAGKPIPLVFWTHNGNSLQNSDKYEIKNTDRTSSLKIAAAKRTDRGEYQIRAVNKLGEDISSFLVTVTDKPSPPGKARVVMTLGKSVTLAWSAPIDDGGCKIGSYIVEYFRIGWNVWLKAATCRQLSTTLSDLIEGSEYKFRVKAENPYGISEASEESDIIFIPDPKRGIITPPPRTHKENNILDSPPVPPRRKREDKVSNASSKSSLEDSRPNTRPTSPLVHFSTLPTTLNRHRLDSSSWSPETSPISSRRNRTVDLINTKVFDRSSYAREITYGSPSIQKDETPKFNFRSRSPSPMPHGRSKSPSPQNITVEESSSQLVVRNTLQTNRKSRSPSPALVDKRRSPSPQPVENHKRNRLSPQPSEDKGDLLHGSSEFMLVLLPGQSDKNRRGHGSTSDIYFDFDEDDIPPPISLSAPELGAEPPPFESLRQSVSSSELLHEKAMARFYQAAAAEEAELAKREAEDKSGLVRKLSFDKGRRSSVEKPDNLPKILINNMEEDAVSLERKHSLRRRLSGGGTVAQQLMWAQRRLSLRNSEDLSEIENKAKQPETRSKAPLERQRSESEEREEEMFAKVREKMSKEDKQGKRISVVEEEKWEEETVEEEEYEESLSEEGTSSSDERFHGEGRVPQLYEEEEEEEETYHPRMMLPHFKPAIPKHEQPFEILSKPSPLPDPNFVPKPILKRRGSTEVPEKPLRKSLQVEPERKKSLTPLPDQPRKKSLVDIPVLENVFKSFRGDRKRSLTPSVTDESDQNSVQSAESPQSPTQKKYFWASPKNSPKEKRKNLEPLEEEYLIPPSPKTERKLSLTLPIFEKRNSLTPPTEKRRASLTPEPEVRRSSLTPSPKDERRSSVTNLVRRLSKTFTPQSDSYQSAPTEIIGLLTAEVAKNKRLQSKHNQEENKVVVDHYSDIVREFSHVKKPPPKLYLDTEELKAAAKNQEYQSVETPTSLKTSGNFQFSPPTKPNNVPKQKPKVLTKPLIKLTTPSRFEDSEENISRTSSPDHRPLTPEQEELLAKAEVKVRSTLDYVTDLAMFVVACWVYLFKDERWAIPILIIMVYRQLSEEIKKKMPPWMTLTKK